MPRRYGQARCESTTRGFTIVELLVASSIALVVMGAITSLFAIFGRSVSDSQAVVEMNNQMRLAANRLRMDLEGATAPLRPPLSAEAGAGYFEIVEGPQTDITFSGTSTPMRIFGDTDDRLVFTTRSMGQPFTGKFGTSRFESTVAEVAWFCWRSDAQPVDGLDLQTLYRKKLLVAGYVGQVPFLTSGNQLPNPSYSLPTYYNSFDVSVRSNAAGDLIPNTLTDLMQRSSRFLHGRINDYFPTYYPSAKPTTPPVPPPSALRFEPASGRHGEDVVLTNVIGFDVRVFDPDAITKQVGSTTLLPGDDNYLTVAGAANSAAGCFVDLGQGTAVTSGSTPSFFSSQPDIKSHLRVASGDDQGTATYDTWTTHYEFNGVNDDASEKDDSIDNDGDGTVDEADEQDVLIDEGTNGVDDDGDGMVDEPDEAETRPPYARPLKAIEIRIRCYEPASKQIRQITIRHAFTQ
jgi:prepilin-type N-terminal cleavage/methylation domain-containing protein